MLLQRGFQTVSSIMPSHSPVWSMLCHRVLLSGVEYTVLQMGLQTNVDVDRFYILMMIMLI